MSNLKLFDKAENHPGLVPVPQGTSWLGRVTKHSPLRDQLVSRWLRLVVGVIAMQALPAIAACGVYGDGVAFGVYQSPFQRTDLLSSGSIRVTCDQASVGAAYQLRLRPGQIDSGWKSYLTNGQDKLYYNLFLDPGRSAIWGDGTAGTVTYQGLTSLMESISVFAAAYKNQSLSPGSYSDTVTIEMVF